MVWDLDCGDSGDGTKVVHFFGNVLAIRSKLKNSAFQVLLWRDGVSRHSWRIWKLIPVNVQGAFTPAQILSETLGSGSFPSSYNGHPTAGQSSTRVQRDESSDEFGTIVSEVTVVTTTSTVTTHKRHRVEDA